jgi:WD40 repeat protein
MRISSVHILVLAAAATFPQNTMAQKTLSEARGASTSQVVMLSPNNNGCAAGIVVGYDDKSVYIATAAHVIPDNSVGTRPSVTVRFYGVQGTRQGTFFPKVEPRSTGDLAVVLIARDKVVDKVLDGLNFSMLSPTASVSVNDPVESIGCFGGSFWATGSDETLLPSDQKYFHIQSNVNEGQSGGGLFNQSWELIGMPLDAGVNQISARPIATILDDLRTWGVPVHLTVRPLKDRAMGAEELAKENARIAQQAIRRNLAQRLATQSDELRQDSPVRSLLLSAEAVNATSKDGRAIPAAREALVKSLGGISGIGLSGHAEDVDQVAFSSDDKLLATGSRDGVIRIWDLADQSVPKCVKVLRDSSPGGFGFDLIAFDGDDKTLISKSSLEERRPSPLKTWDLGISGLNPQPMPLSRDDTASTAADVSQDGELLAVADLRNQLSLYHLRGTLSKTPFRVFSIPPGHRVSHITLSRDGRVVIAGTDDSWVLLWDLNSSELRPIAAFDTGLRELGPFKNSDLPNVDLLDISEDHSLLLTASSHWFPESSFADPTVRVWPLNHLIPSGAPLVIDQSGTEKNKALKDAYFDQGSRFLVAVTLSGTVNLWDLSKATSGTANGGLSPFAQLKSPQFSESTARSIDNGVLVLGQGRAVSITHPGSLESGAQPDTQTLSGLDGSIEIVKLSKSKRFVVAGAIGGTARLWDLTRVDPFSASSSLVPNPYSQVRAIKLSESGNTAVTLRGKSLEFWDIEKPTEPKLRFATDIDVTTLNDCLACQIVISPDDHWVAFQDTEKDRSRIIEIGANGQGRREFTVAARTWGITGEILFTPDSHSLLVEESNEIRVVYDLKSNMIHREIFSDSIAYSRPEFSLDAKWVCFRRFVNEYHDPIGRDKIVGFLAPTAALTEATKRIPLSGFATGIGRAAFSPDSRWIALSGEPNDSARERDDRYVEVMHLDDNGWSKYVELQPIEYTSSGLRFSADGRWLFTGAGDITLGDRNVSARLWNLKSQLTPTSGQQLPDVVWNLKLAEFSPDSKWLVTVSGAEAYARLWSVKEDKLAFVGQLTGPQPQLNNHWSAVFSTDSSSVVIWTTDDATPYYWKLDNAQITEQGIPIPNGDREIEDVEISPSGRSLTILNSGETSTGTSGTEGAHFTFVDLTAFPSDDSYVIIPASSGAHSHVYREDIGLIISAGDGIVVASTVVDSQLRRAGDMAGRNLSWNEWVKSGIEGEYRPTFPSDLVGADVISAETSKLSHFYAVHDIAGGEALKRELLNWARQLDDAEACNNLAWELAKERDTKDSLELSSCALRLSPNEPNYHDTRGVGLALAGQRDEAVAEFEYFIRNTQGIERFAQDLPVRQKWMELIRAGKDPFTEPFE